jgi:hypothetical protein
MKNILFAAIMYMVGCGNETIKECPVVEMPEAPEFTASKKLPTPTKMVALFDYSCSMKGDYPLGYHKSYKETNSCSAESACNKGYFYAREEFASLFSSWLDGATPKGSTSELEILLFNEHTWELKPGKKLKKFSSLSFPYSVGTSSGSDIRQWLSQIPQKPTSKYGCNRTHTKEALQSVVDSLQEDAIIWLVTDNLTDKAQKGVINADDAKRNLDFYNYLESEENIQVVSAYPVNKTETCSWLCGRSLFVYGLFVSKNKEPLLHLIRDVVGEGTNAGLLWNTDLQKIAKDHSCAADTSQAKKGIPLRLKPMDNDVLTVEMNSLSIDGVKCSKQLNMETPRANCTAEVSITNNLNHQVVSSAHIELKNQTIAPSVNGTKPSWVGNVCGDTMKIKKWSDDSGKSGTDPNIIITDLKPKEKRIVTIDFSVNNPKIVHNNSIPTILSIAQTQKLNFKGELYVTVDKIKTTLETDPKDIKCIAGGEDLPSLFKSQTQSKAAHARQDFSFSLKNSGKESAILLLGLFGILGGLAVFLILRFQSMAVEVEVNGTVLPKNRITLPRISIKSISLDGGQLPWIRIRRGWGRNFTVSASGGYTLEQDDVGYRVYPSDDEGSAVSVRVLRGWHNDGGDTGFSVGGGDDASW